MTRRTGTGGGCGLSWEAKECYLASDSIDCCFTTGSRSRTDYSSVESACCCYLPFANAAPWDWERWTSDSNFVRCCQFTVASFELAFDCLFLYHGPCISH